MDSIPNYTASADLKLTDYHIRKLTLAFWNAGAIYGFLFIEREPVFRLGNCSKENQLVLKIIHQIANLEKEAKPMVPARISTWEENGKNLQAVLIRFPHYELFVFGIVIQEMGVEFPKNRWSKLSDSVLTYLSMGISQREKTLLSFRSFTEVFRHKMASCFQGEVNTGILALFHLQDLSPFFKPLGVVKSQEILREVSSTLQSSARKGELCFQMNLRSFYLFCPGETMEGATKRLEAIYFPSKHMILDYKLQLFPVTKEIVDDSNRFCTLFMENF
ncbi:hypothetical protein [Leptospira idonii]|uniref:Uncharacterized protein n=1 Tax=Leptospira idonii TaxID=1193500 RepID=A0A4R9LW39_9LEPT|nr:hypothetical protein [Leptospira idonii]TGN18430.1 hypothetical protein EHS15_13620 [Leptospira idonii]